MAVGGATLAFDTSGPHCAAALLVSGNTLAERFETRARGQAERLFPLLEDLLAEAALDWSDIATLGVGIGPGNFTGIRIAVSAARGLALSLGRPAVGVSTLEALAHDLPLPVIASVAGRRDTVYVQVHGETGAEPPLMVALPDLGGLTLPRGAVCVGDAAEAVARATGGHPTRAVHALAVAIARLADRRAALPTEPPRPLYLRPADAVAPPVARQPKP